MSASTANVEQEFDVAVVGGGPVGLTAGIAITRAGVRTALIARRAGYADNRTTALLHASVSILEELGIWSECKDKSAPLRMMRLVDDSRRLFRAPELRFRCEELGLDAFGYNIENRTLVETLESCSGQCPGLTRFDDDAEVVECADTGAVVRMRQGQAVRSKLVIGADGRHSTCRSAARIDVRKRDLDQSALTLNVAHVRGHKDASTEFHTTNGPCVFVPLPGNRSSVVWVTRPEEVMRLSNLSDEALAREVERQSHSHLGRITVEPARNVFPLSFQEAEHIAARRIALVGDAAHVLPPIGAQGLNLGLRDAAGIAAIAGEALSLGNDPGSEATLEAYRRTRRFDILSRTFVVDTANRWLLSDLLPVQFARGLGMYALQEVGPLRRFVMRQAIAPRALDIPRRH